jgi:RNA polymerase-binding transcription factor
MTDAEQTLFAERLNAIITELQSIDIATSDSRAPVILDQTSVGRLSRMDALQQQAMANATSQRRTIGILQAKAALERISSGEFGYCTECGEKIAEKRLEHNPAVATCITCATPQPPL